MMNSMSDLISPEQWRAMRRAKGLRQHELAAAAGVGGQSIVSNVERGLPPGPEVKRRLLEVLDPARDRRLAELRRRTGR